MGVGTLTIYNASAGSGKTFNLTGIYLRKLFISRYSYRRILAVTFTNKATAEMKTRILDQLNCLATGDPSEYLGELMQTCGKSEEWIRKEAREILNAILHDFSRFSISTIDSFFQKILKAFVRESGLNTGFTVEIDHSQILASAVAGTIASASGNLVLKKWITDFARSNIDDDKGWNLRIEITRLGEELFKERFKTLTAEQRADISNKEFLTGFISEMKSIVFSFENQFIAFGRKCREFFTGYELSDEMFYMKGKGIPSYIRKMEEGDTREPSVTVRKIEDDPPKWCTGRMDTRLQSALKAGLEDTIRESIRFYDRNISGYKSANAIISNIYSLGILSDILLKVHEITTSENIFLLSDAGEFIFRIIGGDQIPFIYEKVGNRYENYMIDEFQDTSVIQWNNFHPLIMNSMAEGFDNLVVGDIKQSIYRWRNSDWKILAGMLNEVDGRRIFSVPLATNWRSRTNIIKFNNTLFTDIPQILDDRSLKGSTDRTFSSLFSEAVQEDPREESGGFVRVEFVNDTEETRWSDVVLQKLPEVVEKLQDKGFSSSDIGIIVRNNSEGAAVLRTMIEYSNNCDPVKKTMYNYNIVSNDSLLLSNSYAVNFIISALTLFNDPEDLISRAAMLRYFLLSCAVEGPEKVILGAGLMDENRHKYFPGGYEAFLQRTSQLPLFEMTENLIGFFNLGSYPWNVAYLNCFQDLVLNFTGGKSSELQSFLEWWNIEGSRKSVVLPDQQGAMRVLTIHKSKGLEFRAVILPFLSWDLDHKSFNQPLLWVKPGVAPFNKLGIVPVRYSRELSDTIFAEDYFMEQYSSYIDNVNLLYVAATRAKDVLWGFAPGAPGTDNSIASVLKQALTRPPVAGKEHPVILSDFYDDEQGVFEFGQINETSFEPDSGNDMVSSEYVVSSDMDSLKLKLHGENYFSLSDSDSRERINYGKLMHEVFESVITCDDIGDSVRKLIMEGKLPSGEYDSMTARITSLIKDRPVSDWFSKENRVMTEAGILMPSGNIRRPDRIILNDDKTIIVDFKFGTENPHHARQVDQYRRLLFDMNYRNIEAYVWYVDKNIITKV